MKRSPGRIRSLRHLFAAFTLATFIPSAAMAQEKVTQLLPAVLSIGDLRIFLSQALFAPAEGIDLSLQPTTGGAESLQYMVAGRGTMGSIDLHYALDLRKRGTRVYAVYAHFHQNIFRIVALESSPLKSLAELKGKTAGVPSRGSGAFPFLVTAAKLQGVAESDIEIVPVTIGPAAAHALFTGKVAVVSTTISGAGNIRIQADSDPKNAVRFVDTPIARWPATAMMVTEDELKNKRKMVVGLMRSFAQAQFLIENDIDAAFDVAKRRYPELVKDQDRPRLRRIIEWNLEGAWTAPNSKGNPYGWFDKEAWKQTEAMYRETGAIDANQSIFDVIDDSLVAEANTFDKARVLQMIKDIKSGAL